MNIDELKKEKYVSLIKDADFSGEGPFNKRLKKVKNKELFLKACHINYLIKKSKNIKVYLPDVTGEQIMNYVKIDIDDNSDNILDFLSKQESKDKDELFSLVVYKILSQQIIQEVTNV